jgi:hypothetical protein
MSALFATACREQRDALVELVEGRLSVAAEEAALRHVAACAACSATLVDTVAVTMRLRRLAQHDRIVTPPAGGWARLRARILAHETMHRRAPLSARLATLFAQGGLKAVVAPLVLLVALATTGAGAQLFATARPGSTLESETALVLQTRLAPEDRPGAVVHGPAPAAMPALQIAHDPRAPEPVGNTQPIARF